VITHIVFFKLKDPSAANIEDTRKLMETLRGEIPQLRHLEIGADIVRGKRSYDLALVAKFDSMEDLRGYREHPFHVEVAQELVARSKDVAAVDYAS